VAVGACASVPTEFVEIAVIERRTTPRHVVAWWVAAVEFRRAVSLGYGRPGVGAPKNAHDHEHTARYNDITLPCLHALSRYW
jgi:hypothetical protein